MSVRAAVWSMAGVAALLAVLWLFLGRRAEPVTEPGRASSEQAVSRDGGDVDPMFDDATGTDHGSETRALRKFVDHLEAMLEPRDDEDSERLVLRVPEHLQDASEAEKHSYLKELLHHGEAMVQHIRDDLASWEAEAQQDPKLAAELVQRRREADAAERGLEDLRARLLAEGVLGDAGL